MFPPGSTTRANLLVSMYNGNLSRTGGHFSNTRLLYGPGGGISRRIVDGLAYAECSIGQGAAWVVKALGVVK
jgi:hypothetical protein